jgi:phosphate transport system substrate-binding protein
MTLRRLAGLALLLFLIMIGPGFAEELRYAGATTLQRSFMPAMARLFTTETAIKVSIGGGNTGPGLRALLRGEVDMAGAGRRLTEGEKAQGLVEHLLGWDVLTIVVNVENPLSDLSQDQLQQLFSGQISNWQTVGGPDWPVIVVTCPVGSGMRSAVSNLILKDKEFPPRQIVAAIVADADLQVAMFPAALTALSRSMVDADGVKGIKVNGFAPTLANIKAGKYPLAKPLTLVTKGAPSGALARFIELARGPQGKTVLQRSFVAAEPPQ